jgi:flagellar biosynthesis/type III secretory pathway chaperone
MEDKYIEKIQEIADRSKSNTKRLDEHDKKIDELEKTYSIMEKMNFRMGKVENAVERIDTKLQSNDKSKGMKWDKLIDYLFYAILAYALFKLGLK